MGTRITMAATTVVSAALPVTARAAEARAAEPGTPCPDAARCVDGQLTDSTPYTLATSPRSSWRTR